MEKKFYVYVYLDPRKEGKYMYGNYEFDYEPFYVGKGKEYRHKRHLNESQINDGSHKSNIIKKLIKLGEYPHIEIVKTDLLEAEALDNEVELIKLIGRYDLNLGPLTNKTDGGEGISGYRWTDEQKEGLKDRKPSRLGAITSGEHKRKIGEANKGKTWKHDTERIENYAKMKSEQYKGEGNPFYGKTHSKETLKKISKRVGMYDSDMVLISEYDSVTECANDTGFPLSKISSVANGRIKHYKKFKFKFI